jgi:hypothetical protein
LTKVRALNERHEYAALDVLSNGQFWLLKAQSELQDYQYPPELSEIL